jgi:IclR family acetate operon transcriptional repressor
MLSLTEIADQVGMHKSTIHRLLATLESKNFIIRDKVTGMYQLGFLFIELSSNLLHNLNVSRWASPYLEQLSEQSGETVDLAVLNNGHVVYLLVVESSQRVKIAAAVGEQLPAFCTASGKAFLAYLPMDEVHRTLEQKLYQYTDSTLVAPEELYSDLSRTRERGYAISDQEYEKDINAVAAPIMDSKGRPMAAIAIVGPSYRMSRDRMMKLGQMLREKTDLIVREVGLATLSATLPRNGFSGLDGHMDGEVQIHG